MPSYVNESVHCAAAPFDLTSVPFRPSTRMLSSSTSSGPVFVMWISNTTSSSSLIVLPGGSTSTISRLMNSWG